MTRSAWRLRGYTVGELLGSGASGEVWRGRVDATGAAVALKRIAITSPEHRRAALSEAAMLSGLDHPHLVAVHKVCPIGDEAVVLVLDLAAGGSLAALLERRGRLSVGEVITTFAPVAAALAYAHRRGVVHGDVSAANILFTDIGLPLLADLGVARLLGDTAPVHTTPAYADPGVVIGGIPTALGDVFMLAGVALHALTGSQPWPHDDPAEALAAAATGDQPDFAGRLEASGVPAQVAAVIARSLSVDPSMRGTAADLALDLRHAATPVAVELSAGRAGPLHPSLPLTAGVRAPSPFVRPAHVAPPPSTPSRSRRHAAPQVRQPRRRYILAGAIAAVFALGILAALRELPSHAAGTSQGAAAAAPTSGAVTRTPSETSPPSRAATTLRPSHTITARPPTQVDAAYVRTVLAELDAMRAAAFATRNPDLLTSVYAASGLLARDRAVLTSIVPGGCGLRGVHTQFADVAVTARRSDSVTVQTRASLARSTLVCPGGAAASASARAPELMRIVLARGRHGYRIASITPK